MKISLDWLSDFIVFKEHDPLVIADRLTRSVGEVEEVIRQGAHLGGCCVGKILALRKHPNADKLSLCDVQTDQGRKQVVCGGTNLRQGMRVAFAHIGTTVRWHGTETVTLEKVKIRGEESEGMICAASELGLEQRFPLAPGESERTIIDLGDGDRDVGRPLAAFLGLTDVTFHIDNHAITNRPDLFSHIGIARECVALGLATWKKTKAAKEPVFPKNPLPFEIVLEQKKLVPRYAACTIRIGSLGETPEWMKRRLEATGFRSINLPIDITNYVMMECGTPFHCFDADDLKGNLRVRSAEAGEKITTLDGVERILPAGSPVISDDCGIFDLLGVMGGLRSSTKETSRHFLLHSAVVDPVAIRTAIIGTGHRTDAATIFEKGVPPVMTTIGFLRALHLFLTLVPGAQITSKLKTWGTDGTPKSVPFSARDVEKLLGVKIPPARAKRILTDLGFTVSKTAVKVPLWRLKDINGPNDLVEEVGRIIGYDSIAPVLPTASIHPPERDHRTHQLRDMLREEGFFEILPLSLVGPTLLKKCHLDPHSAPMIENPLGEEYSLMQPSVLPSMLEHAGRNMLNIDTALATFTISHVFSHEREHTELGILIAERSDAGLKEEPFLRLKSSLSHALDTLGYEVLFQPSANFHPCAHHGRSADIMIGDTAIGTLFELHPSMRETFDLPHRAAVCLVDFSAVLALVPAKKKAEELPQFPSVTYDVTLPFAHRESAAALIAKMRTSADILESVSVQDLFRAKEGDAYNLTLRCVYRAKDRTLTEEEAKVAHVSVMKSVE
ncbi:MAG: phenylalanine--tRNA ligase subunit beta [Candidatus Peregrinibacteria bacterium]